MIDLYQEEAIAKERWVERNRMPTGAFVLIAFLLAFFARRVR